MKKIFRKNQIIITALALMIAVAGYISYTKTNVAENEAIQTAGDNVDNTYDISEGDQIGEIFTDTEDNTRLPVRQMHSQKMDQIRRIRARKTIRIRGIPKMCRTQGKQYRLPQTHRDWRLQQM